MRPHFIPLGKAPHPIWTSSKHSSTATRSTTVQAKILVGTYRCNAVTSKWTGESEACSLPGCSAALGDVVHLLSGECPALRPKLVIATARGLTLLQPHPELLKIVVEALHLSSYELTRFLADPSTNPDVISVRQKYGLTSINPIFRFCRILIWTMHREHMRLSGQGNYLR